MKKHEVIMLIRKNLNTIKSFGVKKIGIFGSVARDEAKENSDIDIIVEFEENRGDLNDFNNLLDFLENLFGEKVDLLTPWGVKSIRIDPIRESIQKEIEYV